MIQAARIIGTGLANTGLIGALLGICVVFGAIVWVAFDIGSLMTLILILCLSFYWLKKKYIPDVIINLFLIFD